MSHRYKVELVLQGDTWGIECQELDIKTFDVPGAKLDHALARARGVIAEVVAVPTADVTVVLKARFEVEE